MSQEIKHHQKLRKQKIKIIPNKNYECYYYGILCYNKVERRNAMCGIWHTGAVFEKLKQPKDYKKTWWNQVEKKKN